MKNKNKTFTKPYMKIVYYNFLFLFHYFKFRILQIFSLMNLHRNVKKCIIYIELNYSAGKLFGNS